MKLTKRLKQVFEYICKEGISKEEIAQKMSVSPHTIKNHEEKLRKMLGLQNRTQIVIYYYTKYAHLKN